MYCDFMKKVWKIKFYKRSDGKNFISEFINSKSISNQSKITAWLKLLKEHGNTLVRPYADYLDDGIYELRIKLSGNQIRVLYFFCFKDYIILTHAFTKNTDKVDPTEIRKCKKFREDFLSRYTTENIEEA